MNPVQRKQYKWPISTWNKEKDAQQNRFVKEMQMKVQWGTTSVLLRDKTAYEV